jgi:hypothetical protein
LRIRLLNFGLNRSLEILLTVFFQLLQYIFGVFLV